MRKVLIWIAILSFSGVAFLFGTYFLAKKYEEPVRNYIVGEVNKRFESDFHVRDINFSLIERFPSASLVMDSVWAEENIIKIGKPDSLFFFRKVYLNLNIFDLINGVYRINEIETKDGFINLLVDAKGFDNFHIWKESADTTGFLLELNKVHIENTEFRYQNKLRKQDYQIYAEDLYFKGRFSDDSYTMAVDGNGLVHDIVLKQTSYLKNRAIEVSSDLDIISSKEKYVFRKGQILIDNALDFALSGQFLGESLDLKIVGNDLDIIKTLSILPTETASSFEDYESSGNLAFEATLKGVFGKTDNPRVAASFSFQNASISRKGSDWNLTELNGGGSIDNGEGRNAKTTLLILQNIDGKLNDDPFKISITLENLSKPTIVADLNLKSDIEGIREFFKIEYLELGEGKLGIDAHIETTISDPDSLRASDFLNAKANGTIVLENALIQIKNDTRVYQIDHSDFEIVNNDLIIKDYSGKINNCSVEITGEANHFLDYLFTKSSVLNVKGKIIAGNIDLSDLFPTRTSDGGEETSVVVAFPDRESWDLEIVANSFIKGKFEAKEISGNLVIDAFKAEASSLHFLSQDGQMEGDIGLYRFADNQFGLKSNFKISRVNITKLFESFENFSQNFITSKELRGTADLDIEIQAFCDSTFNIDANSVISSLDLKIDNGALVGFQPLIDVADYIKKKPMMKLFISADELKKRLENVQFASLTNQITIQNGIISIPEMEIKSSAIDLNVSGTHNFDNLIDYSLDFALSDVLALKSRTEPYNEYVQRDNTGKTRMYLTMKGTVEDFKVDLVKTDFKMNLKESLKAEKDQVKGILKEEFGVFRKDVNTTIQEAEKEEVKIEFDPEAGTESSTKPEESKPTAKPKEEEKNLLNRFIKKTETDKKKLKEGDFEDDDF